jgi:membrane protein required for colicin V production
MFLDAVFMILMALACFKGYSKGFIIAIFSVLGFIVGLAAALKLSATVAAKLSEHTDVGKWLPALSFLLVFIAAVFLVNMAGILLYALLYSIIFSVFVFYAVQLHFIKIESLHASVTYPYLNPLGPKVIEGFGVLIPWFKNMFAELEQFFGTFAKH